MGCTGGGGGGGRWRGKRAAGISTTHHSTLEDAAHLTGMQPAKVQAAGGGGGEWGGGAVEGTQGDGAGARACRQRRGRCRVACIDRLIGAGQVHMATWLSCGDTLPRAGLGTGLLWAQALGPDGAQLAFSAVAMVCPVCLPPHRTLARAPHTSLCTRQAAAPTPTPDLPSFTKPRSLLRMHSCSTPRRACGSPSLRAGGGRSPSGGPSPTRARLRQWETKDAAMRATRAPCMIRHRQAAAGEGR